MDTDFFDFLSRYFWAIGLGVTGLNIAIKWIQLKPRMREAPELIPGYVALLRGFALISLVIWLPMGIGIWFGKVPTIWHFLYPNSGNPYVLAWWVLYWGVIGAVTYWILFRGGAQMLVRHPGFLRGNPKNPTVIKAVMLLALSCAAIATVLMFNQPLPPDPIPLP